MRKEESWKVTLSFDTIATDKKEAYGNAWEVLHDISKLAGIDLELENIEKKEKGRIYEKGKNY